MLIFPTLDKKKYKKRAIPGLFFFILVFSLQFPVNKCSIKKIAVDWIRTASLVSEATALPTESRPLPTLGNILH